MLAEVTFASGITDIISSIGNVGTWVWSLFSDFLGMILTNPLIAFPVLFAVLAGGVGVVLKMIKKFGVKGKR